MNSSKHKATILLVLCWMLFVSGCSTGGSTDSTQKKTKKVTMIYHLSVNTLDPHNSWAPLRAGAVETLVKLDSEMKPSPWLAKEWKSIDPHTWVFVLRDKVTFHDGVKMDAAAVKSSLERSLKSNQSLSRALKIASMEAKGQELTIVTSEPNPALPSEFINPYTSIVSTAAEAKVGTMSFNDKPVGTGAFKVASFAPNREANLVRYEGYWDTPAMLDEVSFQFNEDANVRMMALQSKEADIAYQLPAESIEALELDNNLTVESVTGLRVHYLIYNARRPHMQDIRVRKAFDLLVDRKMVVEGIMFGHGQPANGPFPKTLPFGNDGEIPAFNSAKALELLQEAGYKPNSNGKLEKNDVPLSIQLITYKTRPELTLIAQLFQSEAAKIGVQVEIKIVENIDAHLRENDQWDMVTYSSLSAPRGDGGYFLNAAYQQGGALNPGNIEVNHLAPVLKQLNASEDQEARMKLSKEVVSVVQDEVPHSYVAYPNILVGMNKRVLNWAPGAEEYYIITNKMDVK
ncbi:nickel ABC transporter substrate-binding protein [Paenibacillus arenosi]|uniref:ABC transporter substrate-binding protein n=1 Tax=Paenibacillus arenosi TaxID=2774142 RepID=A0ABR9AWM8_9BACL|nr:nickel ABC transporter substrate-binding protein [Paenibacillus arenosi]MBD8497361.1 ABC transporter substrate-binding protein [Paenibacillus arenosi]